MLRAHQASPSRPNPSYPHENSPNIYKTAATPAATAPAIISPFEMTFAPAPLPESLVAVAVALDSVAEAEELLSLPVVVAATSPNTPPWTVWGEEPCAFAAAAL